MNWKYICADMIDALLSESIISHHHEKSSTSRGFFVRESETEVLDRDNLERVQMKHIMVITSVRLTSMIVHGAKLQLLRDYLSWCKEYFIFLLSFGNDFSSHRYTPSPSHDSRISTANNRKNPLYPSLRRSRGDFSYLHRIQVRLRDSESSSISNPRHRWHRSFLRSFRVDVEVQ